MVPEQTSEPDLVQFIEQFHDHLAPKLDTYEQAIYLYVFRHSRLSGRNEATIGFKSSRRKMSLGIGEKGKPMSESSCYKKLASLERKGCIQILDSTREGTRIRLLLPCEIHGVIPPPEAAADPSLDEMDFFEVEANRVAILRRENNKCFYCLREIDTTNYVIEHVVSRPDGNNSYRNVVAACRHCNNRKGTASAEAFLRELYRGGYLDPQEFEERTRSLELLSAGDLKPILRSPSAIIRFSLAAQA